MLKIFVVGLTTLFFLGNAAVAEEAEYGKISLNGLSRNVDWPNNPAGESSSMVCNVNGPDGYVSVRSGPGTDYEIKRSLKRLAIIDIDTRDRQGHWVKVLGPDLMGSDGIGKKKTTVIARSSHSRARVTLSRPLVEQMLREARGLLQGT